MTASTLDANVTKQLFGKKANKSKQKGQSSSGHEVATHQRVDPYANSDVCAAALRGKYVTHTRKGISCLLLKN